VGGRQLDAVMPCGNYHGTTDQDLRDLFVFLRTLAPVAHRVDNIAPPIACPRCGGVHRPGEFNR
jgi:hypothetical protein